MAILGPWEKAYEVIFKSNGDTTREAFGKHIDELTRIYGILNSLDTGKVSADDFETRIQQVNTSISNVQTNLTNHINSSTNPHPNWKPTFDDITGKLDTSRLTGDIDASMVKGKLTNANIDTGNVNGLEAYIKSLASSGITAGSNGSSSGYADFGNGLQVRWGQYSQINDNAGYNDVNVSFASSFSNACTHVFMSCSFEPSGNDGGIGLARPRILVDKTSISKTGFTFYGHDTTQATYTTTHSGGSGSTSGDITTTHYQYFHTTAYYLAIGY